MLVFSKRLEMANLTKKLFATRHARAAKSSCQGACCIHDSPTRATASGKGSRPLLSGRLLACFMNAALLQRPHESQEARNTRRNLAGRVPRLALPKFAAWHVTTQARLFTHLKVAWDAASAPDEPSRTMVDLGCHAGHGRHKNISDALIWLDIFPGSGMVVGVDAFEDYALDLQYRFDHVPPYSEMRAPTKRAFALGIGATDNQTLHLDGMARTHIMCCANGYWCGTAHASLERRGSDHMCKLTRMRLGETAPDQRLQQQSRFPPHTTRAILETWGKAGNLTGTPQSAWGSLYPMPSMRTDTFWSTHLHERHIDFLKIDMDMTWRRMGLEGLIERQGFTVMSVEVDRAWGSVDRRWNVTEADLFAWFARERGYDVFFKVPCNAGPAIGQSAWYFLVANATWFAPTGFSAWIEPIQDMMLVLRSATLTDGTSLAANLTAQGRDECFGWRGTEARARGPRARPARERER